MTIYGLIFNASLPRGNQWLNVNFNIDIKELLAELKSNGVRFKTAKRKRKTK